MFRNYCRKYVRFVKKWSSKIDLYANIDAIPGVTRDRKVLEITAELSYQNQLFLEKMGIRPVPVVHYLEDIKWLKKYMSLGHNLIGVGISGAMMGGLKNTRESVNSWVSKVFQLVHPNIRIHGFGVTSFTMMIRYPWWSVDSTAWTKRSGYGRVFIPHRRGNQFTFDCEPYCISIGMERPRWKRTTRKITKDWKPIYLNSKDHYLHKTRGEQKVIRDWLEQIGVPLGKCVDGKRVEQGVLSSKYSRDEANIKFFLAVQKSIPPWPQPWNSNDNKTGGFFK
jgi:hypothetical protein